MHLLSKSSVPLCLALLALPGASASAQDDWESVQIETVSVRDGLYMLVGRGGNIGLSVGADGTFLVDDQYAPLTGKIEAAIRKVSEDPVRFLVNTHWHGDHTGGNENMGKTGVLIVAHENVRKRMSVEQFLSLWNEKVPASPQGALPVVTFTDAVSFHMNDDEIRAFHVAPAHTDGDSVIAFTKANVIHMGDLFFNGRFPFVDLDSGGSVAGILAAADRVLALADERTRIIPGHGALAGRAELKTYRDVVAAAREKVAALVKAGRSKQEVVAAKPTAEWDATWGTGFIKGDVFAGILYESVKAGR